MTPTQKFVLQDPLNKAKRVAAKILIDEWRLNLFYISKFVQALNEPIAE